MLDTIALPGQQGIPSGGGSPIHLGTTSGYSACNDVVEGEGLRKIAFYAKGLVPTHAARQIGAAVWTSKLGQDVDISHQLDKVRKGQNPTGRCGGWPEWKVAFYRLRPRGHFPLKGAQQLKSKLKEVLRFAAGSQSWFPTA